MSLNRACCHCRPPRIFLRVMTLLGYNYQIKAAAGVKLPETGYNYQIKSCRWGITTSAGSYIPARRFDPPTHWDTNYIIQKVSEAQLYLSKYTYKVKSNNLETLNDDEGSKL